MIREIEMFRERSRQVQRQGGLGIAVALVSCEGVKDLIPLGIADKPTGMRFQGPSQWVQRLRFGLERM